jgi:hypothetical protein
VDVVAAHAHHLVAVIHGVGGVRHDDLLAAEEERRHFLPFGRHHGHPPILFGERWNGDEVALLDVVFRLAREIPHQIGLLARLDVQRLDLFERGLPIVAKAHVTRRLQHRAVAPGELAFGDRQQLLRRVRDEL